MIDRHLTPTLDAVRTEAFVQSLVDAAAGLADLARRRALSANPMRSFGFDPTVVAEPG